MIVCVSLSHLSSCILIVCFCLCFIALCVCALLFLLVGDFLHFIALCTSVRVLVYIYSNSTYYMSTLHNV